MLRISFRVIVVSLFTMSLLHPSILHSQSTLEVPGAYPDIEAAIAAAVDGDTVLVSPGTYPGLLSFEGKAITVLSTDGPELTIIDSSGLGTTVSFENGEGADSQLEGFTVTGGLVGFPEYGGGIRCTGASPTIINCWLTGNQAQFGANLAARDTAGTVSLIDCVISDGFALSYGGGVHGVDANFYLEGCLFTGNFAANTGGGFEINLDVLGPPPQNEVTLIDCVFQENEAAFFGAGASFRSVTVEATGCEFTGNTAGTWGGAVLVTNSGGLTTSFLGCQLIDNDAVDGGAVEYDGGVAIFERCLFAGNVATVEGGAIDTTINTTELFVDRCTFVGNSAFDAGALHLQNATTTNVTSSIFWDNGLDPISLVLGTVTYSDIQGSFPGTGNIAEDPLFQNPDLGIYTLTPISPCIDAGDPTSPLDSDGTVADMGAFPFTEPDFIRGDTNSDGAFDVADAVAALVSLFVPGSDPPPCESAADANDDGQLDVGDPVYALGSLFITSSPLPSAPHPDCGVDPTLDALECEASACP